MLINSETTHYCMKKTLESMCPPYCAQDSSKKKKPDWVLRWTTSVQSVS